MKAMTTDTMSADEAQRLLDGREAKGRWRPGTVEREGKVWAHDPDALGGASVGEVCIFNANMHAPHNGNRALCAAAPRLAASVVALHAQLAQVTAERDALRALLTDDESGEAHTCEEHGDGTTLATQLDDAGNLVCDEHSDGIVCRRDLPHADVIRTLPRGR